MRVLTHTACLLTLLSFGISGCESADQQNDVADGGVESPDGTPESADGGNEMNDGGDDVVDNDLYAEWFAGYNQGQDTTYLDNGGPSTTMATPIVTRQHLATRLSRALPTDRFREMCSISTCLIMCQGQPRLRCTFMAAVSPAETRPKSIKVRATSPPISRTESPSRASVTAMVLHILQPRKTQPYRTVSAMVPMVAAEKITYSVTARARFNTSAIAPKTGTSIHRRSQPGVAPRVAKS